MYACFMCSAKLERDRNKPIKILVLHFFLKLSLFEHITILFACHVLTFRRLYTEMNKKEKSVFVIELLTSRSRAQAHDLPWI